MLIPDYWAEGTWPINPERISARARWVEQYERKSESFASCRFVADIDSDTVDAKVDKFRELHDEMCRALSDLSQA